jgi:hypothetical protein
MRTTKTAQLPTFNTLLGCFQAFLCGRPDQLARLRAGLDESLPQVLAQVERDIVADEHILRAESRDQQIANLCRQVNDAMPQALTDDSHDRRVGFSTQLEQITTQVAEGEVPGSP